MASRKGIRAGRAYVEAWLDDSRVGRGLQRLRRRFDSFSAGLANIGTKLLGTGLAAGSLFAAPLKRAAEMEQIAAGFESLTGSAEAAAKVMADIRKFGVETPFEFPELANASRKLMAFGVSANDLIPTLRAIGDVSSAIGAPIGEIAEIYGKAKVQGRLFAQDINQLTGRGIPVIDELAKQFGVTKEEVRGLVESGKVDFANLEAAFKSLSGQGGRFFGMMDRQSRTLIGRLSTLKDSFWEAITPIGTALLPYAGKLLTIASSLVSAMGAWIKANAAITVKLALAAAAVTALGAAAIAASFAIRGATFVIGALGIAIRALLVPARLAIVAFRGLSAALTLGLAASAKIAAAALASVSITLRTLAAAATLTGATIRGFAVTIAAVASGMRIVSVVTAGAAAAVTFFGGVLQLTKRITASTAVVFRVAAGALGLFTFATRLAAMGVVAASGLVRLAGAAFATFGAIVNTTALAISGVGTVLMLLGNPIGGVLLAIAAIGAAIYYARGVSIDFGGALDWLMQRFGPLADQALAAFGVIRDAIMAGDWKTAASLLWSGLQAAFLRGKVELLKIWDDLTSGFRTGWQETMAGLTGMWAEWGKRAEAAAHGAYAGLVRARAAFSRLIGKDELAAAFEQEATAENFLAEQQRRLAPKLGEKAINESLAQSKQDNADRKKLREEQEAEAAAAEQAFAASTAAAKASTDAAKASAAAATPTAAGAANGIAGSKGPGSVKASNAINIAAVVGTSAAQDALFKALGGSAKGITPGDRLVAEAIDRFNAAEARRHREAMKNSGSGFFKVEKV